MTVVVPSLGPRLGWSKCGVPTSYRWDAGHGQVKGSEAGRRAPRMLEVGHDISHDPGDRGTSA
jgi:hypothetical protein